MILTIARLQRWPQLQHLADIRETRTHMTIAINILTPRYTLGTHMTIAMNIDVYTQVKTRYTRKTRKMKIDMEWWQGKLPYSTASLLKYLNISRGKILNLECTYYQSVHFNRDSQSMENNPHCIDSLVMAILQSQQTYTEWWLIVDSNITVTTNLHRMISNSLMTALLQSQQTYTLW